MVSKAFKTCLLLIEKMVKHNYINQIDKAELEKLISMYIGADPRTIKKYVSVCVQFEFLKPHIFQKKGQVSIYSINLVKADQAMTEVYGRNLRQLQLFQE